MAIDTTCPGCGRKLRVSEDHAGRQARCPVCSEIYTVPGSADEAAAASSESQELWRMRTPEGQTYGPVDKTELDSWVGEGRVVSECQLSRDGEDTWCSADAIYPVLRQATPISITPVSPQPTTRYVSPHRGGIILALGIMSWAFCFPIFGVFAWVMGSADLREMAAGRMDSTGIGLTQAGQMIGMINAILWIIGMVIAVFVFLFAIAA